MTGRYPDPVEVEAVPAEAAERGLTAPVQLPGDMAWQGCSLVATCAAEIAELERARCRLLEYRVVATGGDREVFAVALSAVAKRSLQLLKALEYFRSVPTAARTVRP